MELALELLRTSWDNLAPALSQGRVPGPEAKYVRELAEPVDNGDQVQTSDLGPLLQAFDNANKGTRYPVEAQVKLMESFEQVKESLDLDVHRWRHEIVELSRVPA